jgi:hypothetical protein
VIRIVSTREEVMIARHVRKSLAGAAIP